VKQFGLSLKAGTVKEPSSVPDKAAPAPFCGKQPAGPDALDGRYAILKHIATTSLSRIYLAARNDDGTQIALKVPRDDGPYEPELCSKRIEREAKALKALRHANVVGFVESGKYLGDSCVCLEYLDGLDLETSLNRIGEALPWSLVKPVLLDACRGLDEVHRKGMVHSDIKLANLFLVASPGALKLVDFGNVKFMEASGSERELSTPGTINGTIDYIAPEQVMEADFDLRADIYSLGVCIYQLLTGAFPFKGDAWEVLEAHKAKAPPRIRDRACCGQVSRQVEDIVMKSLEKNPDKRFQSAADMGDAISGCG
jgi:serine/threonine protein kinase